MKKVKTRTLQEIYARKAINETISVWELRRAGESGPPTDILKRKLIARAKAEFVTIATPQFYEGRILDINRIMGVWFADAVISGEIPRN